MYGDYIAKYTGLRVWLGNHPYVTSCNPPPPVSCAPRLAPRYQALHTQPTLAAALQPAHCIGTKQKCKSEIKFRLVEGTCTSGTAYPAPPLDTGTVKKIGQLKKLNQHFLLNLRILTSLINCGKFVLCRKFN